jgi:hypothetical protein
VNSFERIGASIRRRAKQEPDLRKTELNEKNVGYLRCGGRIAVGFADAKFTSLPG